MGVCPVLEARPDVPSDACASIATGRQAGRAAVRAACAWASPCGAVAPRSALHRRADPRAPACGNVWASDYLMQRLGQHGLVEGAVSTSTSSKTINRVRLFEFSTARFVSQREDACALARSVLQDPPRPGHRTRRHPTGLSRHLPAKPTPLSRNSPRLTRLSSRADLSAPAP